MLKISEKEIGNESQKWIAVLTGTIGACVGMVYYDTITTTEFLWDPFWFIQDDEKVIFSIPCLTHGIVGLFLLVPLYIRKILKYRDISVASVVLLITNIYLFSSWSQLAMGFSAGFSNSIVTTSLILAITLSWIGMRSIAGFCWIIIIILCAYNMIDGAEMLSAWGIPFLILSILSIWIQTKMPLDEYFSVLKGEFSAASNSSLSTNIASNISDITPKKLTIKD